MSDIAISGLTGLHHSIVRRRRNYEMYWARREGNSARFHPRQNAESLIVEEYNADRAVLRKTDERQHWRNGPFVLKLSGWVAVATSRAAKLRRARIKKARAKDPELDFRIKASQREKNNKRTLTPEQKRRRAERARVLYHSKHKHDPRWKAEHNLRVRLNKFLDGHKSLTLRTLLGCSKDTLIKHLGKQFQKGMGWKNYGRSWQIDHVTPCAEFDLTNTDDQRKCFHFSNLRPMWALDNNRKGKQIVTHQPELLLVLNAA